MPTHLAESRIPPESRAGVLSGWSRWPRIARHLPRLSPLESNCLVFLCASVVFLAWFDAHFHEFWRDEVQALLIGHHDSLRQLIESLRVEGVPPLSFVLLKIFSAIFAPPRSLALYGAFGYAILLGGTYTTCIALSRNRTGALVLTCLFAATDALLHEYGVVVRLYGLGLGLALGAFGLLVQSLEQFDRRKARAATLLGALAVLTSTHTGCLAGSVFLWFVVVRLARGNGWKSFFPVVWALPAFAFTAWIISPYANRTSEGNVARPLTDRALQHALAIWDATVLGRGWWGTDVSAEAGWAISTGVSAAVVITVVVAISQFKRLGVLAFVALTLTTNFGLLAYIGIARYQGAYRHNLCLLLPVIVTVAALSFESVGASRVVRLAKQWPGFLLAPWFLWQYSNAYVDLSRDHAETFSSTKAVAPRLPARAVVLSDHDTASLGLLYWRPDLRFRTADSAGRELRHILADNLWHERVPLESLIVEECQAPRETIFVTLHDEGLGSRASCASLFVPRTPALITSEQFDTWQLDCACVRGVPVPSSR